MTDAPDGPTEGEPERGTRRSPRVGDSGSPVGSTLSIVLAVVAVIAGFLILRAITDDNGDDASDISSSTEASVASTLGGGASVTEPSGSAAAPTSTTPVKTGATVVVANASGIGGSAGAMSTALQTAGYTMGTPGNSTGEQLATSVVYYAVGDVAAQAVATSVAAEMGGLTIAEMPAPPPIDAGLGTATVLVMLGTDTANKTLADLNPTAVTPPAAAGVTTTT